jgi:alanine racemase
MPRPLTCEISIAAMRHNLERVREYHLSGRNAPVGVWSVVKANAYGHGLENALTGFASSEGLALVEVDYAHKLRQLGWEKPILLLEGPFDLTDVELARQEDFTLVIHRLEQLRWLQQTSAKWPKWPKWPNGGLDIWLKFNTGMNRLGFTEDSLGEIRNLLADLKALGVNSVGLVSHFANSDVAPHEGTGSLVSVEEQLERFTAIWLNLKQSVPQLKVSLSNSSAVMGYQQLHDLFYQSDNGFPWLRPGVMLYGGTPYADLKSQSAEHLGLRPAMALRAKIIGVQVLASGDTVGYGSRFIADGAMRVGIVAAGYADGYPRHAPDGTPVWVGGVGGVAGQRTQLVGRVSMDMMVIDITNLPQVGIDSEVELWGANLPIDEVAQACGTIGYELMCAVAPRVARVHTESFLS